jgi:hypothetical protein
LTPAEARGLAQDSSINVDSFTVLVNLGLAPAEIREHSRRGRGNHRAAEDNGKTTGERMPLGA